MSGKIGQPTELCSVTLPEAFRRIARACFEPHRLCADWVAVQIHAIYDMATHEGLL